MIRTIVVSALALLLLGAAGAKAATLQPIGSFASPIYVTSDPGNAERLFVVEQAGRIVQVENGQATTFADLRSVVQCAVDCGEQGLLSIALAPDFAASGRLYVDYASGVDGMLHVAELRAGGGSAAIGTLRNVLTIPHPEDANHNGGQLQFGPDGYLYVSTGDGGGQNDKHQNAQNLERLLGKILRIDPQQSGGLPYTVPAGNPFLSTAGARGEIWSYGLRNPFRFSFDRLSGDLTIGDVGQVAREEIDHAAAPGLGGGADYGWNCREGFLAGPVPSDPECASPPLDGFVDPAFDYPHLDPGGGAAFGCAVIGGYVVRDRSLGALYGRYIYGDHCAGEIRSLDLAKPLASDRSEGLDVDELDSFGEDSCGRLYAVSGKGQVYRLVGATPAVCAAVPFASVATPRAVSYLGIRAVSRRVKRGGRATITVWASPCKGRRGEPVKLRRGHQRLGTRYLDRVCSVRFRPRIGRRADFRATIREDATYLPAQSRRLTIRVRRGVPKR
jgi:Glucose / Sorbosone dehydrogenase